MARSGLNVSGWRRQRRSEVRLASNFYNAMKMRSCQVRLDHLIGLKARGLQVSSRRSLSHLVLVKQSQNPTGLADDLSLVRSQIHEFKSVAVARVTAHNCYNRIGGPFDPEAFDVSEINRRLHRIT